MTIKRFSRIPRYRRETKKDAEAKPECRATRVVAKVCPCDPPPKPARWTGDTCIKDVHTAEFGHLHGVSNVWQSTAPLEDDDIVASTRVYILRVAGSWLISDETTEIHAVSSDNLLRYVNASITFLLNQYHYRHYHTIVVQVSRFYSH